MSSACEKYNGVCVFQRLRQIFVGYVVVFAVDVVVRSVLVKRMFRPSDDDLSPSPHKLIKEETQKRGSLSSSLSLETCLPQKSITLRQNNGSRLVPASIIKDLTCYSMPLLS